MQTSNDPNYQPTPAELRKDFEEVYSILDSLPDLRLLMQDLNLSPSVALELEDAFANIAGINLEVKEIAKEAISLVDDLEAQEKRIATMQAQLNEWTL